MDEMTPRERRHERTREAILTAAQKLVAERGADSVSLRAIARRIDYSPAGLYEYFDSKEEIIDALCERGNARFSRALRRVPLDLPVETYLVELLQAYVDFARENPELYSLMFTQLTIGTSEVPVEFAPDDTFTVLITAVQRAVDEGIFATDEAYGVFEISYTLWALAHGMAMLQINYLRDFNFDFRRADRLTAERVIEGLKERHAA